MWKAAQENRRKLELPGCPIILSVGIPFHFLNSRKKNSHHLKKEVCLQIPCHATELITHLTKNVVRCLPGRTFIEILVFWVFTGGGGLAFLQPFYQPGSPAKALDFNPDFMDAEEIQLFSQFSKCQHSYLALRNIVIALWNLNPKVRTHKQHLTPRTP